MTYCIGVDLGTSFTAAAIFESGRAEIVELGQRRSQIPSVVYIPSEGAPVVGDAAERRAVNEPDRVVREFKRRLGDQVGSLVGNEFWSAEALMAQVLMHVVTEVTRRQGGPPELVALTHPANWGPYKLDLLTEVARLAHLPEQRVLFVSEPVAAALHHSHRDRARAGQRYVVYDLGGGTFDATVVLVDGEVGGAGRVGRVLGEPGGLERLGGMDFDEALRGLVEQLLGQRFDGLDTSDAKVLHGLAQLRNELVEAKEALSTETHVEVPLFLPGAPSVVRLTRIEFEQAIRPRVYDTMAATDQVLRSAGLDGEDPGDVIVLLVGGSSRIPLISRMVAETLELPTALDEHPKHAVALGAARVAAQHAGADVGPGGQSGAGVDELFDLRDSSAADASASWPEIEGAAARFGLRDLRPVDGTSFAAVWGDDERPVGAWVRAVDDDGVLEAAWVDVVRSLPRHPYLLATHAVEQLNDGDWPGMTAGRLVIGDVTRGASLRHELEARGAIPLGDVIAIGVQLAGALATLHRHRLAHGSLSADAVVVTSWIRSPKVKLGVVGAAGSGDSFRDDARAMAALLVGALVGKGVTAPIAAELRDSAAPASFQEAIRLLEADVVDDGSIERAGDLQRVELEEGRIPTECTVMGPEPTGTTDAIVPVQQPPVSAGASPWQRTEIGGSDQSPAANVHAPVGVAPPDATIEQETGPAVADVPGSAAASSTAVATRRIRVAASPLVKAGWGDAPPPASATDESVPAGLQGRVSRREPEWVQQAGELHTSRADGRPHGSAWSNAITRWVIPAAIGAVIAAAAVLVVVGR